VNFVERKKDMVWTLKIFKSYGGRVANSMWLNAYHIFSASAATGIEDPAWLAVVNQFVQNERTIHLEGVNFMRATLSTARKENFYDPKTLRVFELNSLGGRGGQVPMMLDLALKVKKNVAFGRSGTSFYRGCVFPTEVTIAAGGAPVLTSPIDANLTAAVNAWPAAYADELAALSANLVMLDGGGTIEGGVETETRTVQSFSVSGLSINKRNHRYFDTARSDDGVGVGT
jgi:hypothetical protein